MIIWINGTYGVGKTTVANKVNKICSSNSKVIEPDKLWLSSLAENPMIVFGDGAYPQVNKKFLDYLNSKINKIISNYEGLLIIPMTLTERLSYNKLIEPNKDNIKQFILQANEDVLYKRIYSDNGRDTSLATTTMHTNIDFLNKISDAIHIDTSNMTSDEVANCIISKI